MNIGSKQFRLFMCGVYFSSGLSMTMQDWMGLKEYKRYLELHWVDFHWGVGATLCFVAIGIFYRINSDIRKHQSVIDGRVK